MTLQGGHHSAISNQALGFEDKFTYLGSIGNLHGGTEEDITSRLPAGKSSTNKSNVLSRISTSL